MPMQLAAGGSRPAGVANGAQQDERAEVGLGQTAVTDQWRGDRSDKRAALRRPVVDAKITPGASSRIESPVTV